jgi:hypothetical protein
MRHAFKKGVQGSTREIGPFLLNSLPQLLLVAW